MLYALSSSLCRWHPQSRPEGGRSLALDLARGERGSFQAVFRTDDRPVTVTATVAADLPVQVRRVGWALAAHMNTDTPAEEIDGLEHLPGYVPDPLFPEPSLLAAPFTTYAFWLTVQPPADAAPGVYPVAVTLTPEGGEAVTLTATVRVHAAVLPVRHNFPVTHWFYADALLDWYKLQPFEEGFWRILDPYLADVATHGQDTIYVPMFTPPLDGVKRPTQLLHVTRDGDRYRFDWSLVQRWVTAAQAQGVRRFEWTHLFTQWGVKHALRIYRGHGEDETLLWPAETGATSAIYRDFLAQFLPQFERFLQDEKLMDRSFFHLSDEPHGEEHLANYRAARELLRELAPWMRVMDALSELNFAAVTDLPIPSISTAPDFVKAGIPAWAYFCCAPRGRYLNRLLDTPLPKIRMAGWLLYRLRAQGFLHWGYNYWYQSQTRKMIDPFTVTDGLAWPGWAHGDTCMVYPGPDGPIDSLRWEVFAESLQDYALLQGAGVDPDDPLLAAITDYQQFPKDAGWIMSRRAWCLKSCIQSAG